MEPRIGAKRKQSLSSTLCTDSTLHTIKFANETGPRLRGVGARVFGTKWEDGLP